MKDAKGEKAIIIFLLIFLVIAIVSYVMLYLGTREVINNPCEYCNSDCAFFTHDPLFNEGHWTDLSDAEWQEENGTMFHELIVDSYNGGNVYE